MQTMSSLPSVAIVGAGLAGCECARVLARSGVPVTLFEQKPGKRSPAHRADCFSELVCSNSLRNDELASGIGLLKQELRDLASPFMAAADATRVPAGKALAVDRVAFSQRLTDEIRQEPIIRVVEREIASLDDPALDGFSYIVVAAGPLASEPLSQSLAQAVGMDHCYFYDAIAPIVWTHSLDMSIVFRGSRYQDEAREAGEKCRQAGHGEQAGQDRSARQAGLEAEAEDACASGAASVSHGAGTEGAESALSGRDATACPDEGDYLNCPMNREEYFRFYEALCSAEKVQGREFEKERHFEGCMPVEALAERGPKTLCFGPLKPVGFTDPRTGRRPWALLQLRMESLNGEACNLVGCQTKLTYPEQARVFRLVPGLEHAEFVRFGSMHRNTYVNAPAVLNADGSLKARPSVFLAGQITGVEGYVESAAHGHWIGRLLAARLQGKELAVPPATTALGALLLHLKTPQKRFQPSNVHFGLMPVPEERLPKKVRKAFYGERGRRDFGQWLASQKKFIFLPEKD